jgi:uncharacterized protein
MKASRRQFSKVSTLRASTLMPPALFSSTETARATAKESITAVQTRTEQYPNTGLESSGLDVTQEWIIGGGQFALSAAPGTFRRAISVMSLGKREPKLIDLDFFPHGFAIDPVNPSRIASFQKIGLGAALVDLASGRVLQPIPKHGEQLFYGHGAFTADGKLLLSTERDEKAQRGLIGIRDSKSLAYLGEFPSFGDSPHDCHLIEGGKTLVVANGDGSVAYIDLKSQKLLEKLTIPNLRFNAGHLQPLPQRKVIAVSAPAKGLGEQDLGGVSVRLSKASWASLNQPMDVVSKMVGEALSVSVSLKHGVFGVTHPSANLVTFWSLDQANSLGSLSMIRPRGIEVSVDGSKFLLSYGQHAALAVVDASTLRLIEQAKETAYFSGSHIVNWSRLRPRS